MESIGLEDSVAAISYESQDPETKEQGVSAADLQRANTNVVARLGDVACEGRDSVSPVLESEY